jgi:hypothetical protein
MWITAVRPPALARAGAWPGPGLGAPGGARRHPARADGPGAHKAAGRLYGLASVPEPWEARRIGERRGGWRSRAAVCFWYSLREPRIPEKRHGLSRLTAAPAFRFRRR